MEVTVEGERKRNDHRKRYHAPGCSRDQSLLARAGTSSSRWTDDESGETGTGGFRAVV